MADLLDIHLGRRAASTRPLPASCQGLGGRGLTAALLTDEVPALADPLGGANKLILAPGLLAGTSFPNSGRLSVGAKSPLTGGIKESNSGGGAAQRIARLGFAAILLEGESPEPVVVRVGKDGVSFLPAAGLWGLGVYETVERLGKEHPGCGIVAIGPAGERTCKAAAVCVTAPDNTIRTAARGGLGAVMGRMKVKALLLDDEGCPAVAVAHPERFRQASRTLVETITTNPFAQGLGALGTAMLVNFINELGALPTRNYSAGRFENAANISGETLAQLMGSRPNADTRHRCMSGCVIGCSQVFTDAAGVPVTSGFEYETLALMGSNCGIADPDALARIDRACDDMGVDTIELGAALGVAMEAGKLAWGDGAAAERAIRSLAQGDPQGLLLANGCVETGRAYGVTRVPAVKGQSLAAYDPRVLKATGVGYATSAMGADHTACLVLPDAANPAYDVTSPSGQAPVSEMVQSMFAVPDTLGVCLFAFLPILTTPEAHAVLVEAVSAKLGAELPPSYLMDLGQKVCRMEKAFNRAGGFTPEDDKLPDFFRKEPLSPSGLVFDVPQEDLGTVFA